MSQSSGKRSLQQEIKKRKTQELLRTLEAKPPSQPIAPKQTPTASAPQSNATGERSTQATPINKRTTQIAPSIMPGWTKRQKQVAVAATILAITVCIFTGLIANGLPTAQPPLKPLPRASVGNLLDYLESVNVPIDNLQTLSVPNETWDAREEIQFSVNQNDGQGIFIVLSYDSPSKAIMDSFKVTFHQKFKTWKLMLVSNILLLASPETAQTLVAELASHVTQYLIAPYRSFIPTATPQKVNQPESNVG
jgi:hypothetical protein